MLSELAILTAYGIALMERRRRERQAHVLIDQQSCTCLKKRQREQVPKRPVAALVLRLYLGFHDADAKTIMG